MGLETLPRSVDAWPPLTYLWLSGGLAVVCLLTGWLGDTDNVVLSFVLVIVVFVGVIGASTTVANGLAVGTYNDLFDRRCRVGCVFVVAIGAAFIVQGDELKLGTVVTIGVALIIAIITVAIRIGYVTADMMIDVPVSLLGGLAGSLASSSAIALAVWIGEKLSRTNNKWFIAVFGILIVGIPGLLAGLTAGFVANDLLVGTAFGIVFSLANVAVILVFIMLGTLLNEKGYLQKKDYSSWLARGSFGGALVWVCVHRLAFILNDRYLVIVFPGKTVLLPNPLQCRQKKLAHRLLR